MYEPHQITIVRNDPQMPGKPCAFFIDCTCGWGADYVSTNREAATLYAAAHKLSCLDHELVS